MARYNTKTQKETVINHQGGTAVKLNPKFELINLLSNGLDNTFYESVGEKETRFIELIKQLANKDTLFVAKALIYARSVMGQRTITHFGAAHLAKFLSGNSIAKRFYSKRNRKANEGGIIYRLDDMLEIMACYMHFNKGKAIPSAMKRGFALALEQADKYELAKYQGKGKQVSLVDVINLVHPKPSKDMEIVFKSLMEGNLKQFNTVEDKNTSSGQKVAAKLKAGEITETQAKEELTQAKEDNYRELITSNKIGYLALLRNVRNILLNTKDVDLIDSACALLTNSDFIKKSLVFPYQIDLALEIILQEIPNSSYRNKIVTALNKAYELSIPNMSEMNLMGRTAVVIDSSGSMTATIMLANKKHGSQSAIKKAALIGATFAKGLNADVFHFADTCAQINFNPLDSVHTISKIISDKQGTVGYGTSFSSIPSKVKDYDRIYIISDMQGRDSVMTKFDNNKHIYCVNLVGYSTTVINPNSKVYQLFGYSSEMFELAKKVEIDPNIILKEIESIMI